MVRGPHKPLSTMRKTGLSWRRDRQQDRRARQRAAILNRKVAALQNKLKLLEHFQKVEQEIRNKLAQARTLAQVVRTSREVMEGLDIGGVAVYRYNQRSHNLVIMERAALDGVTRYEDPHRLLPGEKRHFITTAGRRGYSEQSTDILLIDRVRDLEKMNQEDRAQAEQDLEFDLRRYFGQDYQETYADKLPTLRDALRYNLYVRFPGVAPYEMIIMANAHVANAEQVRQGSPPRALLAEARQREIIFQTLRSLQKPITDELQKASAAQSRKKRIAMDSAIDELQQALNEQDNLQEMFGIALQSLGGVYQRNGDSYAGRSSIMLLDKEDGVLRVSEHLGLKEETAQRVVKSGEGIAGHVFEVGKPLLVRDVETNHVFKELPERSETKRGSFMCVPITFKDNRYGVLNVRSGFVKAFTQKDLKHLRRIAGILAYKIREVSLTEKLERAANYDGLTGLARREHAIDRINGMLAQAGAQRIPLAFVMADLDHFKQVNDRYGHEAGDSVLRGSAAIISDWLDRHAGRFNDAIASRWGGEEWVVAALGLTGSGATELVEDLRQSFEARKYGGPEFWGEEMGVTASFGIAVYPFHARTLDDLASLADRALYTSKETRNKVTLA